VAAPLSTIDLATADGEAIPIEQRNAREVTHLGSTQLAPDGASVWNPAFDVTPHRLVAGIITEKGVARAPYTDSLKQLFRMNVLGIETSCDETAAAVVTTTAIRRIPGASKPMWLHPRRQFTASGAVWCRNSRRASTSATSAVSLNARCQMRN
jgi:hypothetical protein